MIRLAHFVFKHTLPEPLWLRWCFWRHAKDVKPPTLSDLAVEAVRTEQPVRTITTSTALQQSTYSRDAYVLYELARRHGLYAPPEALEIQRVYDRGETVWIVHDKRQKKAVRLSQFEVMAELEADGNLVSGRRHRF